MVAIASRLPKCLRRSHAVLLAILAAALVVVTLTHLRSTSSHAALAVLHTATTLDSRAALEASHNRPSPQLSVTSRQPPHDTHELQVLTELLGGHDDTDNDASGDASSAPSADVILTSDSFDEAGDEDPVAPASPPAHVSAAAPPPWAPPNATVIAADLDAFTCHYFQHLIAITNHSCWELLQPAAVQLLVVLGRLRPVHRCGAISAAAGHGHGDGDAVTDTLQVTTAHPTTGAQATALLAPLRSAVGLVAHASCGGNLKSGAHPAGAFAAVRRLTMAVMQQLWMEQSGAAWPWRDTLAQVAPEILSAFKRAHGCGAAQRPAMELFHISKSGGTSACQLARSATRRAQRFDQGGNCMQQRFSDEPRWITYPDFRPPKGLPRCTWVLTNCTLWVAEPEVSCQARQEVLLQQGLDFYSNEHALHGSTPYPGSAHTCPQFESLVVLRDPLLRAEAHIIEIIRTYVGTFRRKCARTMEQRARYTLPRTLEYWARFAPSPLDNYNTRSLLGKHFHCVPFGSLTKEHLHHAQLKLLGFDYITVLEEDPYNDVIFRLGMGWPETLRLNHMRWGEDYSDAQKRHVEPKYYDLRGPGSRIEGAGGFPPNSSRRLAEWNALDGQLLALGKVALRLDAQFFATAAVFDHRFKPSRPPPPADEWRQEEGMPAVVPLSVRMMVEAGKLQWSAKTQHFIPHPEVVSVLPLPVDAQLLLFNAAALLGNSSGNSSTSGPGSSAVPSGSTLVSGGSTGAGFEFVCPDSSQNGTRKVWSAARSAKLRHGRIRRPNLQVMWTDALKGARVKRVKWHH